MTVIEKIAEYIVAESEQRQPTQVIHHAKRAFIDWFAAMYPGSIQDPNPLLRQAFLNKDDTKQAVIFPYGQRSSVKLAAFLNGASAHTSEFDDIFRDGGLHPGCATIAAALALGEHQNQSGSQVISAVTAGYEVSSRVSAAMGREHYQFWHTTGTIATFGAAAAGAILLDLNLQQTAHALATSATLAAGLQQAFRSNGMSKPLHSAHAAETGVMAAMAASKGVTGALDVLEGSAGMGAAMSGAADWGKATEGLGDIYNIESITFKNHGCCGHTFAAIDGLLAIMSANQIKPAEIASIDISTYGPAVEITDKKNPKTSHECKFSMQYVVAHAAHYGSVRVNAFEDTHMQDPAIRAMLKNINLTIDPEIDSQFPIRRAARICVTTKSGQSIKHYQHTRKGDPDLPLSDDELNEKFTELTVPLLGEDKTEKLLKNLWRLDQINLSECLTHATKIDCK
jgi:2-methylcitrate dehydratase PrpD